MTASDVSIGTRLAISAVCACAVSIAATVLEAQQSRYEEHAARLRTVVDGLIGKNPLDCGALKRVDDGPERARIETKALERALACAKDAASKRQPFVTYIAGYGFDSWLATGLMGNKQGTITRFHFDSLTCRSDCRDAMKRARCRHPIVGRLQNGEISFLCE